MNVPSGLLAINMISEKLSGFFGFRATAVVRMQVNAQRFQQGILLLNYVPIPTLIGTDRLSQINANIVFKSQLPSVRMNISNESEVVFRIPFVSPQNFYQRREYSYDWAQFRATVYSPIVGGSAQVTCWCHFEDVEPVFPIAQSGKMRSGGPRSNRYDPADEEDSGGVLSSASSHFSRAFGDLSKVPLLTSIAAPTAWFLGATSKLLASFGFSNPVTTKPRLGITPKIMSHANNCDTEDNSDSHGLFLSNKVARLPGFAGTDIDEMSLQYITSIPSYLTQFSWSTSNIVNATLYSQTIRPRDYQSVYTVTANSVPYNVYAFTPIGYVSMMHQYWRGTIKFRFLVAKTEYHSGRVQICFNPDGTNGLSEANSNYTYRWVWDLRESNEFEIEIPYVASTPWRTNYLQDFTGYISVFVLNPLVAPTSVSSTINFLVEVCGGEDFQVAAPVTDLGFIPVLAYGPSTDGEDYLGYTVKTVHVKSNMYKEDQSPLEAEGPGTQVMQRGNAGRISSVHDKINPLGSPDDKGTSSLYTIGEMVTSFRQILKRSCLLASTTFATASRDRVFSFNPFAVYLPTYLNGSAAPVTFTTNAEYCDWYSWIVPCYAMRRGSVITKVYNGASNADCSVVSFLSYGGTTSSTMNNDTSGTRNEINYTNNMIASSSTVQGALETLIPFYSSSHSVPITLPANSLTLPSTDTFAFANHPEQRIIATSSNASNYIVLNTTRQIADDFDLGLFLGVLPLRAYSATSATYPI
jgi:hypothetical protein